VFPAIAHEDEKLKKKRLSMMEKIHPEVPKHVKAMLWELADELGVSFAEYVRGVLIQHCREVKRLKYKEVPSA